MKEMNPVGWFEIPVKDMKRAITFYEKVFDLKLEEHKMDKMDMAWFPMKDDAPGATGSLVHGEMEKPSADGTTVYFTAPDGDVDKGMKRVEENGGKMVMPKTDIGEHGFIGIFLDTEGNKVAMHSMKG